MKTHSLSHEHSLGSGRADSQREEPEGAGAEGHDVGGRPGGYDPTVLTLLQCVIRATGISDSAAAVRMGMSTSSLSRWKMEHPELRAGLMQAREECRALKLGKVLEAAEAQEGRGWRAAAWFLERVFPGDYSPRQTDRLGFQQMEARAAKEELERETKLAEQESAARQREYAARARELETEIRMLELEERKQELARRRAGQTAEAGEERAVDVEAGVNESEDEQAPGDDQAGADENEAKEAFYSEGASHSSQNLATPSSVLPNRDRRACAPRQASEKGIRAVS